MKKMLKVVCGKNFLKADLFINNMPVCENNKCSICSIRNVSGKQLRNYIENYG